MQRRAGVEFETSIPARIRAQMAQNDPLAGFVPQDEDMMVSGQGWKVVSDNSKLEFVTDPPVDPPQLAGVVNALVVALRRLPVPLANQTNFEAVFDEAPARRQYAILPYQRLRITGAPQGTIGIPFERLFDFFDLLTRHRMGSFDVLVGQHETFLRQQWTQWKAMGAGPGKTGRQNELIDRGRELKEEKRSRPTAISQGDIAEFGTIARAVNVALAAVQAQIPDNAQQSRLRGLLHFMGQYMLSATRDNDTYKKRAFSLMTRSSFHSMYRELGGQAQARFVQAAESLRASLGVERGAEAFLGHVGSFAIGEWIDSIHTPVNVNIPDADQAAGFRSVESDLMTAPGAMQVGGYGTDASMGSIGLDNGLVVFELRNLRHYVRIHEFTLEALVALTNDLVDLVARA